MTEAAQIRPEFQEQAHLKIVLERIKAELDLSNARVRDQYRDFLDTKRYLSENKADMDHAEKVSVRQTVDELGSIGQHTALSSVQLHRLLKSPYFGRIDFSRSGRAQQDEVYIGIHSFYDPKSKRYLVHDWRAPISSMFYDFEIGPAWYIAPSGKINGEIRLKRQYKVANGKWVFMLESSLNIHDDVLQEELSRASSEKMKNIVATIQRDQNSIIRNEHAQALIIQGAAGSGKTSIALHRIAFLLYRFKDTIRSSDILIISPNKVFSHYISNVLPELGEENIRETTMEELAKRLTHDKIKFQTFYEQVGLMVASANKRFMDRISYRASAEFLSQLEAYILHVKNHNFTPSEVVIGRHKVGAEFLKQRYLRMGAIPTSARINELVLGIVELLEFQYEYEIKSAERNAVRKQVKTMFGSTSVEILYKRFFEWAEVPEMFKMAGKGIYEYADVFPFLFFTMEIEGLSAEDTFKHLVIDEMQDYTAIQYAVVSQLFSCRKTILGDANQSVNPLNSSTSQSIQQALPGSECVFLNKSYRSTIEISSLAQRIKRNPQLIPIERHGDEPKFIQCDNSDGELYAVREGVTEFMDSPRKSLGIICKTQAQAELVFEKIVDLSTDIHLINSASTHFNDGITVANAHLAKGLEFDQVILPFCGQKTYQNEIDRQMLYVGATRAMHRLTLVYSGPLTQLIGNVTEL